MLQTQSPELTLEVDSSTRRLNPRRNLDLLLQHKNNVRFTRATVRGTQPQQFAAERLAAHVRALMARDRVGRGGEACNGARLAMDGALAAATAGAAASLFGWRAERMEGQMTEVTWRRRTCLGRRTGRSRAMLMAAFLALGLGLVCSGPGHAQTDTCLSGLPTPKPNAPSHRVVQLVNCSNATLLGAANAAHQATTPLDQATTVMPREGTWIMGPANSGKNVLTIDIPPEWEATIGEGALGPRFWARTGCRYDIASGQGPMRDGRLRRQIRLQRRATVGRGGHDRFGVDLLSGDKIQRRFLSQRLA
jgi:hypothetical protein